MAALVLNTAPQAATNPDAERRARSFAKLRAKAAAAGANSPMSSSLRDFDAARAEVDRIRAACRERGTKFVDPCVFRLSRCLTRAAAC
jgi:hypothetical protein